MTEEDKYSEPRAHELRERYVATFGGADDLLVVRSLGEAV